MLAFNACDINFTPLNLPAQPFLAAVVPEDEEDYPCTVRKSIIRNQSKGLVWSVSVVRTPFEKTELNSIEALVVLALYILSLCCIAFCLISWAKY